MIFLLLVILCMADAAVYRRKGVGDEVEGMLYEIPEDEDPEFTLMKFLTRGVMPVSAVIKIEGPEYYPEEKDATDYYQTDDIKKELDDVRRQLQAAKAKVEKGDIHIYTDIDKLIHNLMNLMDHLHTDFHSIQLSVNDDDDDDDEISIFDESAKKSIASDISTDQFFASDISKPLSLFSEVLNGQFLNFNDSAEVADNSNISSVVYFSSSISILPLSLSNISSNQQLGSGNGGSDDDSTKMSVDSVIHRKQYDSFLPPYITYGAYDRHFLASDDSTKEPIASDNSKKQDLISTNKPASSSLLSSTSDEEPLVSDNPILVKSALSDISKYEYSISDNSVTPYLSASEKAFVPKDSSKKSGSSDHFNFDISEPPYLIIDTYIEPSLPSKDSIKKPVASDIPKDRYFASDAFVSPYLTSRIPFDHPSVLDDSLEKPFASDASTEHLSASDASTEHSSASDASTEHSSASGEQQSIFKIAGQNLPKTLLGIEGSESENIRHEKIAKTIVEDKIYISKGNKHEDEAKVGTGKKIQLEGVQHNERN